MPRADRFKLRRTGSAQEIQLECLELHREGVAWRWGHGIAFAVRRQQGSHGVSCSCAASRKDLCEHIKAIIRWEEAFRLRHDGKGPHALFCESVWFRIASALAEGDGVPLKETSIREDESMGSSSLRVVDKRGVTLAIYLSAREDRGRFLEYVASDNKRFGLRGGVLDTLVTLTRTPDEVAFAYRGVLSRRQILESSLVSRIAYHGFREIGAAEARFSDTVSEGVYWLCAHGKDGAELFRLAVPPDRVELARSAVEQHVLPNRWIPISPEPVIAQYRAKAADNHGLVLQMVVPENVAGCSQLLDPDEYLRFGNLVYYRERDTLGRLIEPDALARRLQGGVNAVIDRSEVPAFLDEAEGLRCLVDATDRDLRIHRRLDRVELFAHALEQSWYSISVSYGLGSDSISLNTILRARAEGKAFIEVSGGWLDCRSPEIDALEGLSQPGQSEPGAPGALRATHIQLLRLSRKTGAALCVKGVEGPAERLRRMVELAPAAPLPELRGLVSKLRPYQKRGAEWLIFLFENMLGGLLCDDMGLGKTHQVMALMVFLREHTGIEEPFLVVCPATVLSHWAAKLRDYVPELPQILHHGGEREADQTLVARGVVLTSYGTLRNDASLLSQIRFSLAVFDEAQQIKNAATKAYDAAQAVNARMKLAVTGTPIENSLADLKALMDLTVPGYLGSDGEFSMRYADPSQVDRRERRDELARLISPFTLRRLKSSVLLELPEKIEDLRTCRLSEEQVKLYRDALSSRSAALLQALDKADQAVPYVHVFALLTLLKQICDHPALLLPSTEGYESHSSGKWELFTELLSESLESGQKVVVFTHFLGMIDIMERYLSDRNIGFAALTGKSRKRGQILERFQQDSDCRVFLASLKAGGTGIDLVAGSVVIHYDRWWNAAAEDQATDRVHRIGQTRGVQIFKLVTEGTLEEKISAIIERKRALLRDVVAVDDPGLLKSFSREELSAMLTPP